ncbi:MAG: antitoxin Xre/MbcA/ParS toxin-binding domain-containing protein [Tepidisphaeraceae bacterium]
MAKTKMAQSARARQRAGILFRYAQRLAAFASRCASSGKLDAMNCRQPGDSIGSRYNIPLDAVKLIESGLPFAAIKRFQKVSGLTLDRIKRLARISEGSFARRKRSGRLTPEESERLLRLGRVFERATCLYDGDQAGARQWLETPVPALGNHPPLDLARTEPGAREVEDLIGRIENGIVS